MLKKLGLIFLSIIFMISASKAQDEPYLAIIDGKLVKIEKLLKPQVNITGAKEVEIGDGSVLRTELKNQFPEYVKNIKYKWSADKAFFEVEGGTGIAIFAGMQARLINVNVLIELTYLVNNEVVVIKTVGSTVVKVGNAPNPVPPNPTPNPTPNLTEHGKFAYDVSLRQKSLFGNNFQNVMLGFASAYRGVASAIAAGTLKTPQEIGAQVKLSTGAVLDTYKIPRSTLDGKWQTEFQDYMWNLYEAGKLKTLQDYINMMNEMSEGFKAAVQ